MRNPAMHISLTDFKTVLTNVGLSEDYAMSIFSQAVPYNIKNRYEIVGNAVVRAKAAKAIKAASPTDITPTQFNRLLTAQRIEIGHKHITPIRQGGRDFMLLKEITQMACDFCHACGFESIHDGCKAYIHLGLEKMRYANMYGLSKFKYYDAAIYKAYESYDMIQNDPKPNRTRKFHDCYAMLLMEYAAIERDLRSNCEDYVCFVYARLEADKVGADVEDWLRAQFEELNRIANVIPSPNQLFSENALKRYYSYFKSFKDEDKVTLDYDAPKSEFEKKYAEKLREKHSGE